MSDLWSNEYGAPAGKGAKARKRLRLQEINNRTMDVSVKKKRKIPPKPYEQKAEHAESDRKRIKMSQAFTSATSIKAKVRLLVIERDVSYLELLDILKQQGIPLSGVAAGNLRSETREILKLLEQQGLINTEALARRRKKLAV